MAGAGYKLFVNGNTLSASDLNTYVQQQTVMVFASASARTTALASVLAEGMVSYRTDSHVFEIYNGSAWVSAGISSPLTTKGDLWGYDTAGNRIPVGSNNQVLTADSTQALGVKWATPVIGSMTLLSTTTLSGASTTVSSISQSYTNLMVVIFNYYGSVAGNWTIKPNGTNAIGNNVVAGQANLSSLVSNTNIQDPNVGMNNAQTNPVAILNLGNYSDTTMFKPFSWYGNDYPGSSGAFISGGAVQTTSAISSLVFATNSGTWTAGTVKVYGVN